MKKIFFLPIPIFCFCFLATAAFPLEDFCALHKERAQVMYGKFNGISKNHFKINHFHADELIRNYLIKWRNDSLPPSVTFEEIERFVESLGENRENSIIMTYAKVGDKTRKTIIQQPNHNQPWVRIQERIINASTSFSITHDDRSVVINDSPESRKIHKLAWSDPCDLLYPYHAVAQEEVQVRTVEKNGRQVLMTSWSNNDENGDYLSIQAMLDDKTLLPIYSLLAFRLPHQSATSYFLCKFDDYAQFNDTLFPQKWTITNYCQLSSQGDKLFKQNNNANKAEWMIRPEMEFKLQQVDMIQTLPFMKQHIYDFKPLDPAPILKKKDSYFWCHVDEGYHFKDSRKRHNDLYAEYNQALKTNKNVGEMETKIRKVWGTGPYVVRR